MTYSVYLKSGQVITGVLQSEVDQLMKAMLALGKYSNYNNSYQWFSAGDRVDFMFDAIHVAAIYPERKV